MKGRRLPVVDGRPTFPTEPGDYCGPVSGFTGDRPCVIFLKPHARDDDTPSRGRSVQHVTSPPHVFTEEDDGTLTIRESIGNTARDSPESDGWHGYLTRGVWERV